MPAEIVSLFRSTDWQDDDHSTEIRWRDAGAELNLSASFRHADPTARQAPQNRLIAHILGANDTQETARAFLDVLHGRGYDVALFELPGMGRSTAIEFSKGARRPFQLPTRNTLEVMSTLTQAMGRMIHKVVEKKFTQDDVIVTGNAFGGTMAAWLMSTHRFNHSFGGQSLGQKRDVDTLPRLVAGVAISAHIGGDSVPQTAASRLQWGAQLLKATRGTVFNRTGDGLTIDALLGRSHNVQVAQNILDGQNALREMARRFLVDPSVADLSAQILGHIEKPLVTLLAENDHWAPRKHVFEQVDALVEAPKLQFVVGKSDWHHTATNHHLLSEKPDAIAGLVDMSVSAILAEGLANEAHVLRSMQHFVAGVPNFGVVPAGGFGLVGMR